MAKLVLKLILLLKKHILIFVVGVTLSTFGLIVQYRVASSFKQFTETGAEKKLWSFFKAFIFEYCECLCALERNKCDVLLVEKITSISRRKSYLFSFVSIFNLKFSSYPKISNIAMIIIFIIPVSVLRRFQMWGNETERKYFGKYCDPWCMFGFKQLGILENCLSILMIKFELFTKLDEICSLKLGHWRN